MMRITVIAVGRIKERYLQEGIAEYLKRLTPYAAVDITEVKEEEVPERLSVKEMAQAKRREGERILQLLRPEQYIISLALSGKAFSSEALAATIDELATYGTSHFAFLIGGSLGLSDEVLKRSNLLLSFSKMTFPHQLMRLILLEQIYRLFKINRGEPYHK